MKEVGTPVRALSPEEFYPIDHWEVKRLIRDRGLPEGSASIHLWNSNWRKAGLDPDVQYDPRCIYEQLVARFLPEGMLDEPIGPARFGPGAPPWRRRLRHAAMAPWRRIFQKKRRRADFSAKAA
jgi:hypothetical protein